MSRVYFSFVNVRKSCNISILLSGVGLRKWTSTAARMHSKQTERNKSESKINFMIVTVKGLL